MDVGRERYWEDALRAGYAPLNTLSCCERVLACSAELQPVLVHRSSKVEGESFWLTHITKCESTARG
jgi:hypothetical protein